MIRHRPAGLGHPYRLEPDQRVPVRPVAGEPVELRATTDLGTTALDAEIVIDGIHQIVAATSRPSPEPAGPRQRPRRGWSIQLDAPSAGSRVTYRFVGGRSRTRWFEYQTGAWTSDAKGASLACDGPQLVAGSVAWLRAEDGPWRVRLALRLEDGAHVVGFGERFDALDQRGRRLDATVFEQYKDQGNRTYLPVPFAIVVPADAATNGWGFHVRSTGRTWYDVGATDSDRIWIEIELDPSEAAPRIEVAIYEGAPADVLAAFLAETGRPRVPPAWIFRPWMSGNEWNSQARAEAEVQRSLDEGIPVGVLVLEAWSDESTFAAFRDAQYPVHPDGSPHELRDFTFPEGGAWPDPVGFVERMHRLGIRVLLWQVPLLKADPSPGSQARADRETALERGYVIREADGRAYRNRGWWFPRALLPDWTNNEAVDWWLAKRRYLVDEVGIDGFKTDGGEHAWGAGLRYADGTSGIQTNNRFPVLYQAAYHRLLREAGREPVTFSRAGFTGAGATPCHWAGDEVSSWAAFRASITAGLTAAASGIFFWGWDLAGFSGEIPDAELFLRGAAMATFCPIMEYHSEFNDHRRPSRDRTPWNIAERTGDPGVLTAYRRFAELREHLVPYLVEQAARSAERARPLMRPLFFEWPNDPVVWDYPYQYLLGDHLLVAPVVEPGVEQVEVYVPEGTWADALNRCRVIGPARIAVRVPRDEIPVMVRISASGGSAESLGDLLHAGRRVSRGGGYDPLGSGRPAAPWTCSMKQASRHI
ncbi:MAG: glycoside hydrolase family 31 protein [Candidatus Limnocylindrales bacterium]